MIAIAFVLVTSPQTGNMQRKSIECRGNSQEIYVHVGCVCGSRVWTRAVCAALLSTASRRRPLLRSVPCSTCSRERQRCRGTVTPLPLSVCMHLLATLQSPRRPCAIRNFDSPHGVHARRKFLQAAIQRWEGDVHGHAGDVATLRRRRRHAHGGPSHACSSVHAPFARVSMRDPKFLRP